MCIALSIGESWNSVREAPSNWSPMTCSLVDMEWIPLCFWHFPGRGAHTPHHPAPSSSCKPLSRRAISGSTASDFVFNFENSSPMNLYFLRWQMPTISRWRLLTGAVVYFAGSSAFVPGGSAHFSLSGWLCMAELFYMISSRLFVDFWTNKVFICKRRAAPYDPPEETCCFPQTLFLWKLQWPFN